MTRTRLLPLALLLLLALVPGAASAAHADGGRPATTPTVGAPYSLLQMNLCLSGAARCFAGTEYPRIVDEAVERIVDNDVTAVTLNEACSGDVEEIAERTGYHFRFTTVIYNGAPFVCRNPGDRGVFGNAVLTKEAIRDSEEGAFSRFSGVEERRWLCVTTARRIDVCTSHFSTDGEAPSSTNSTQCAELSAILAARARTTIFAGDVNRRSSCAPEGFWTLTDADATQAPGIQHAYGDLLAPTLEIEAATYTDHDVMVVRGRLPRP